MIDLQAVRAVATTIAREAGAVLMEKFDQPHQQRTKRTVIDIVTEGDTASEAVILAALRQHFPDHHIVSEEGGGQGSTSLENAEYVWYVDPLDGTTNYASNIPFFSVSIGMSDRDGNPLVGVVYDPFGKQIFSAAQGFGATLNDKPIHVSSSDTLETAVLCAGFPYDSHTNPDNNLPEWSAFTKRTRALRCMGSAALEMAFVAAGRLDGFWEQRIHAWDVTAGIVLIREAGGIVTDYNGQVAERMISGQEIVSSNGLIQEQMLTVLREARIGR
jgi:myo-inositol-1(or 4)-monophosphatase